MKCAKYKKQILYPLIGLGLFVGLYAKTEIPEGQSVHKDIYTKNATDIVKFKGKTGTFIGTITANGGNNKILFKQDGIFGLDATLIANHTSTNTLKANHIITLTTDVTLKGENNIQCGGNTINILGETLTLKDNQALKSFKTTKGSTYINFKTGQSNSKSPRLIGNLDVLEGSAILQAKEQTKGIFQGDVLLQENAIAKLILENSSSLTFQGNMITLTEIGTTNKKNDNQASIILDGKNSSNGVNLTVINSLKGEDLTIFFDGAYEEYSKTQKSANLTLNSPDNIIKNITLKDHSLHNTLKLRKGDTQINSQLMIDENQELAIELEKDAKLTLQLSANNSGILDINFKDTNTALSGNITTMATGETTLNLGEQETSSITVTVDNISNSSESAINTFNLYSRHIALRSGSNEHAINLSSGMNTISFENSNHSTLSWQSQNRTEETIEVTGGNTSINFKNSGTITKGIHASGGFTEITIATDTIATIREGIKTTQKGRTLVDLTNSSGILCSEILTNGSNALTTIKTGNTSHQKTNPTINGDIITKSGNTDLEFSGSNNTLTLKGNASLTTVTTQGQSNGISLYYLGRGSGDFKTLTIGNKGKKDGISGEGLSFLLFAMSNQGRQANSAYADRLIIHSSQALVNDQTIHTLGVRFHNQETLELNTITYLEGASNNILVASVANSSGIVLDTSQASVLGFDVAQVKYIIKDEDGYMNYYIGGIELLGISQADQEAISTAYILNYDLYLATFNSLNQRLGELRDNPQNQGVWTRILHGSQSNQFGLGTQAYYTALQLGYDYDFKQDYSNYLGFALTYAFSTSTPKSDFEYNGEQRAIKDIKTQAIEFGVYNTFFDTTGWYNDNIIKFAYFTSNFEIQNLNTTLATQNTLQNFAFVLSNEVGYLFSFGENKEWEITSQFQLSFGYFNQSHFKQTLKNSPAHLDSIADALFTLRTKFGSSFGYDFKHFGNPTLQAKAYLAMFYAYDYISGGEIEMRTQRNTKSKKFSNLASDSRLIINMGSNLTVFDNTRIYFDFEKSFLGKISTEYQINLGVRYSFGGE